MMALTGSLPVMAGERQWTQTLHPAKLECSAFRELRPDHAELVSEVTFKGFESPEQVFRITKR
jgi:hypothetical protein